MAQVPPGKGEDRASGSVPPGPRRAGARRTRTWAVLAVLVVAVGLIAAIIGLQPRPAPVTTSAPPVAALIVSVSHAGNPVVSRGFRRR